MMRRALGLPRDHRLPFGGVRNGRGFITLREDAERLSKLTACRCQVCRVEGYWENGICPECLAGPKPIETD